MRTSLNNHRLDNVHLCGRQITRALGASYISLGSSHFFFSLCNIARAQLSRSYFQYRPNRQGDPPIAIHHDDHRYNPVEYKRRHDGALLMGATGITRVRHAHTAADISGHVDRPEGDRETIDPAEGNRHEKHP